MRSLGRVGPAVCLLLTVSGLLFARPAAADAPAAAPPDSLTAARLAFVLRYGARPGPATGAALPQPRRDRWLARDKARHAVFSALWTVSTQYVLVNKGGRSEGEALPVSIASGAAVGLAKEAYDAARPERTASARDLAADAVGIELAAAVIVL